MKALIFAILFCLVTGCATTSSINMKHVIAESARLTGNQEVNIINIPSHGVMGDSLAIAAGGGANAEGVKKSIEKLIDDRGGTLVVTSTNPELAKVNIVNALKGVRHNNHDVFLVYAGSEKYSEEVRVAVEDKGMRFYFVNAYHK